jgi:glycogen synthase kinase 3 beta
VVVRATDQETGEVVAIKKVWQDPKYKNRERKIMQLIGHHPNICEMKNSFYSPGAPGDKQGIYLHLVLEVAPTNLHLHTQKLMRAKRRGRGGSSSGRASGSGPFSLEQVKLYTYQLCRAVGHLRRFGVCHRDVKPDNVLIFPKLNIVKLCDFGSAKALTQGQPNASYICSRCVRWRACRRELAGADQRRRVVAPTSLPALHVLPRRYALSPPPPAPASLRASMHALRAALALPQVLPRP